MENKKLNCLSNLPEPPYYVVVFASKLATENTGYAQAAQRMMELAVKQEGFLGVDSVREGNAGITVSYWKDESSILNWKKQQEHMLAQKAGRSQWYDEYSLHVAKVERSYNFKRDI